MFAQACPISRVGCFSFHRYRDASAPSELVLARACKTAAHEILHNYAIGHCVHRHCLMNGSGHLLEDYHTPSWLCPVDLAKLQAALPGCELLPRYRALLSFCEARPAGFGEQAAWLRRALAVLEGPAPNASAASPAGSITSTPAAFATVQGANGAAAKGKKKGSKRPRDQ